HAVLIHDPAGVADLIYGELRVVLPPDISNFRPAEVEVAQEFDGDGQIVIDLVAGDSQAKVGKAGGARQERGGGIEKGAAIHLRGRRTEWARLHKASDKPAV